MKASIYVRSLGIFTTVLLGCTCCASVHDDSDIHSSGPSSSPSAEVIEPVPYPHGRWRVAGPSLLENAVLWTSHILIRHAQSDDQVPGTVFRWRLSAPPSLRTRAEALALANDVANKAAKHPEAFAQLVEEYSEDITTRASGGSLGGARAAHFRSDPAWLDALTVLRPGEVSRVVETSHGFHVLLRRAAPPPAVVSGSHIVIGHEDAPWLRRLGAVAPMRTRSEALVLARQIQSEALTNPASFPDLVRRYSDHPDKIVDGDMGSWSVQEPTHYPREVELLRGMAVGGVSAPMDGHCGIEIVQRTPDRARPLYAMESIKLAFEPSDPSSRQESLDLAHQILGTLAKEPERFDEFRAAYCWQEGERWFEGRDGSKLSSVVAELSMNQVAKESVEHDVTIVIPKRVAPETVAALPAVSFEVPAPETADLHWLLKIVPARIVARELAVVAEARDASGELTPDQMQALQDLLRSAASPVRTQEEFASALESFLERETSGKYRALLAERTARVIMGLRPVEVTRR